MAFEIKDVKCYEDGKYLGTEEEYNLLEEAAMNDDAEAEYKCLTDWHTRQERIDRDWLMNGEVEMRRRAAAEKAWDEKIAEIRSRFFPAKPVPVYTPVDNTDIPF